jgi:hypothetical protein
MEAKFGPLEERIKNKKIGIFPDEIFQKNNCVHLFDHKRNEEILKKFGSRTS